MAPLNGRIAIVTGASRGVGRGVARALAHQGARVFVTGRSLQDHASTDSSIVTIRCDIRWTPR